MDQEIRMAPSSTPALDPFPGLLIYAIVALIVQKKMELKVPLCDLHHMERKRYNIIGTILLLGCIPLGVVVSTVLDFEFVVGFLVFFVTIIAGVVFFQMANLIKPSKIDNDGAQFTGAGEAFLNLLPQKPY